MRDAPWVAPGRENLLAHPFAALTCIHSSSPRPQERVSALTQSVAQILIERGVGEFNLPSPPSILWHPLAPPSAPLAFPALLVALYQRLRRLQVRENKMREGGNPDETQCQNSWATPVQQSGRTGFSRRLFCSWRPGKDGDPPLHQTPTFTEEW